MKSSNTKNAKLKKSKGESHLLEHLHSMHTCGKAGRENTHNRNHGCINYAPCGVVMFFYNENIAGENSEPRWVITTGRTKAFGKWCCHKYCQPSVSSNQFFFFFFCFFFGSLPKVKEEIFLSSLKYLSNDLC